MPYTSQRKEKEPIAEGWCFFFNKLLTFLSEISPNLLTWLF